jgi:hypothetical protein
MPRVKSTAKPAARRVPNVVTRKVVSSEDLPVAPEGGISVNSQTGAIHQLNSDVEIEGNVYGFQDKAAKLAFMEEPVTIILAESTEKNPEQYVFVAVNGIGPGPNGTPWIPRNQEVTIKRKYLAVLAGARPVRYRKKEFVNQMNGELVVDTVGASADRYPFQVVEDQNPRGREWLRDLRASKRAG